MATKIVSRDNYCINYIEQRCKEPGEVLSVFVVNNGLAGVVRRFTDGKDLCVMDGMQSGWGREIE
jgi:hypothetical protein